MYQHMQILLVRMFRLYICTYIHLLQYLAIQLSYIVQNLLKLKFILYKLQTTLILNALPHTYATLNYYIY